MGDEFDDDFLMEGLINQGSVADEENIAPEDTDIYLNMSGNEDDTAGLNDDGANTLAVTNVDQSNESTRNVVVQGSASADQVYTHDLLFNIYTVYTY